MMLFVLPAILMATDPVVESEKDMRCMAVIALAMDSISGESRETMTAGAMFYYGRIEGRTPDFDLEARMAPLLTDDWVANAYPAELKRCGDELSGRKALLNRVGRALLSLIP